MTATVSSRSESNLLTCREIMALGLEMCIRDRSDSASATTYGSSSSSQPTGKTCDAGSLQSQIGQKATQSVLEDLRTRSGATTARILRPGQLVTMEYNDTRLNLIVDDKDVMTAIRCG